MQQTRMEQIAAALRTLLPGKSWKMYFTPNSAEEFLSAFEIVTGVDAEGSAVYSKNPTDFGVTWAQVEAEIAKQGAA